MPCKIHTFTCHFYFSEASSHSNSSAVFLALQVFYFFASSFSHSVFPFSENLIYVRVSQESENLGDPLPAALEIVSEVPMDVQLVCTQICHYLFDLCIP